MSIWLIHLLLLKRKNNWQFNWAVSNLWPRLMLDDSMLENYDAIGVPTLKNWAELASASNQMLSANHINEHSIRLIVKPHVALNCNISGINRYAFFQLNFCKRSKITRAFSRSGNISPFLTRANEYITKLKTFVISRYRVAIIKINFSSIFFS